GAKAAMRWLELRPDTLEALELLAVCLSESGEWEATREVLTRILQICPDHTIAKTHLPAVEETLARQKAHASGDRGNCPAVSVVIPCYKLARYLPEAVASVVAQTFRDWELIIVNDGSPDETSEVARRLIAEHGGARIQLIEQANAGLSAARNAGIRAGRGKYVLPLDADDKLDSTMLERAVALVEQRPEVGII